MTTCNAPCNPPCMRPARGGGLCGAHYSRRRRGSRLDTPIGWKSPRPKALCAAPCDPPCNRDVVAKDLCNQHYRRQVMGMPIDVPLRIYKETREVEQAPPPPPPNWRDKAACKGQDTNKFFPDPSDHEAANWALAWCKACPVVTECLEAQLAVEPTSLDMRHGVYGGTLPGDRHSAYRAELSRAERARAAA